jgi:hypothetical protein
VRDTQLIERTSSRATAFTAIVVVAWVVVLVLYLRHTIVLSSDSINNHVHVWWIADRLWHHGRVPWRFPLLGHGQAFAYPYGFVNWTTAALLWPLLGDRAVTLWSAVGVVGCAVATFVAFPELRRGWWVAAVLLNSALIEALLFGQQSFAWGSMLLLFGIACWRRGRRGSASLLVGAAQLTHVVVVAPMTLVLVLLYLPFTRDRWAVIRWYAVAAALALPALYAVFASPSYNEAGGAGHQIVNFFSTVGTRILIVVVPIFFVLLQRVGWRWLAPASLIVPIGFNIGFYAPLNVGAQWHALMHSGADTASLDAYLHSPEFVPGAIYRVLRGGDGKLGLYRVVRARGRLDSELFPESMAIKSFHDTSEYVRVLCDRDVDQIIRYDSYDRSRHTNEHAILDQLHLPVLAAGPGYQVYAFDHRACG